MNWKKLFKDKKLEELTDKEIETLLKRNHYLSIGTSVLMIILLIAFMAQSLTIIQVANSFTSFDRLTIVLAGALIFIIPFSLYNFVSSARSFDLTYVQLRSEQRLREVEKKLGEKQK